MSSLLARRQSLLDGTAAAAFARSMEPTPGLERKDATGGNTDTVKLAETIDAVGRGFEEFKKTVDLQIKEVAKGYDDPVLKEKLAKITDELIAKSQLKDQLQGLADANGNLVKRLDEVETSIKRVPTGGNGAGSEIKAEAEHFERATAMLQGHKYVEGREPDVANYELYCKSFAAMMRTDERQLSADQLKALSTGALADGGYMLTPQQSNRVLTLVRETSPMRALATVETIGTDTLEFLVDEGEAAMGWVGETGSRPETGTPQLAKRSITTGEQYANPAITQKLLDDATMDPVRWLDNKVADKFGRTEATAFVLGDGVNKPRGFLNYAAGTNGTSQIERFTIGPIGASAALTSDLLIDMVFKLPDPYASRGAWLANRFAVPMIMKLKDSSGQYLWQPGLQQGAPATLLGRPMRFAADMPVPAPAAESIAFGDWAAAYTIVDRIGIRTLRDPYTNKPYVHFYSTRRVGGAVVDFRAIIIGKFGAAE